MNTFRHFDRTPWMRNRPISRSLPTQESRTQKEAAVHPRLERD